MTAAEQHFRKKPVVVTAAQWFKNGDHPDDNCEWIEPDPNSTTQFEPFLGEGKLVRLFRRPDLDGSAQHDCGHAWDDHGWIDTLEGGHTVCPGDWIITGVAGELYPCKPDIFEATYEEANDE